MFTATIIISGICLGNSIWNSEGMKTWSKQRIGVLSVLDVWQFMSEGIYACDLKMGYTSFTNKCGGGDVGILRFKKVDNIKFNDM